MSSALQVNSYSLWHPYTSISKLHLQQTLKFLRERERETETERNGEKPGGQKKAEREEKKAITDGEPVRETRLHLKVWGLLKSEELLHSAPVQPM